MALQKVSLHLPHSGNKGSRILMGVHITQNLLNKKKKRCVVPLKVQRTIRVSAASDIQHILAGDG